MSLCHTAVRASKEYRRVVRFWIDGAGGIMAELRNVVREKYTCGKGASRRGFVRRINEKPSLFFSWAVQHRGERRRHQQRQRHRHHHQHVLDYCKLIDQQGDVARSARVPLLSPCRYAQEKLSVRESDCRCPPLLSVLTYFRR